MLHKRGPYTDGFSFLTFNVRRRLNEPQGMGKVPSICFVPYAFHLVGAQEKLTERMDKSDAAISSYIRYYLHF